MRDMTENEKIDVFQLERCPACRKRGWYEGGSAGISQNLYCANCGLGINISLAFSNWGQIIEYPRADFPRDQLFDPDVRDDEPVPYVGGFKTKPTRSIGDSKFLDWIEGFFGKLRRVIK